MASDLLVTAIMKPKDNVLESLHLVEQILLSDEFPIDYKIYQNGMTCLMLAARVADS
jgi:hypothetical protein